MLRNILVKLNRLLFYTIGFVATSMLESLFYALIWKYLSSKALNQFLFSTPEIPLIKAILAFFTLHVFLNSSDIYPFIYEIYLTIKGVMDELFKPKKILTKQ